MRNKVKQFLILSLKFSFSFISFVEAFSFNVGPRNLDRFYNLTNNVDKAEEGDERIFSSTTLVVNNSTVIRAITFIIGSLLIFLPLLLVAGLKMGEEGGGGYGYSEGSSYHGDFSRFGDGWEEYQSKKRKRKPGRKRQKSAVVVQAEDNETSRSSSQSKLGRFELKLNFFVNNVLFYFLVCQIVRWVTSFALYIRFSS